ncbi:MAG: beta-1,6-N-acetylglucosaminyltransferase [Dysgonamonadaceae bacterium]|jgi:hypothetical protein|nr:beta-1,6-N-acetylglucosaminyltransferase [Dysgonamonadaceae bacterium]
MNSKHAYLIIAHQGFEQLKYLLEDLDHELNDIYVHIDLKVKNVNFAYIKSGVKHSKIYFIDRIKVNWGGFSQIRVTLNLLTEAVNNDIYKYYHLITGETFPLKSQDSIHNYFKNHNKEFIGFNNNDFSDRVKYIYLFNEIGKISMKTMIFYLIRKLFLFIQRLLKTDITRKYKIVFKKGFAYWSITHKLAVFIVDNTKLINRIYKHSFCCDEVFVQTLVYNSPFYHNMNDINDEYKGCKCLTKWRMHGKQQNDLIFHKDELNYILASDALFARKFSGVEGMEIIRSIKEMRGVCL